MKYVIDKAKTVKIGDVIVVPTLNDNSITRDMHCVVKVQEISNPHPEITEFKGELLADAGLISQREEGPYTIGMRHHRKICIIQEE